jgi:hypothetical protein
LGGKTNESLLVSYILTTSQLSGKRRVTLSEYKKMHLVSFRLYSMVWNIQDSHAELQVNIREYYEKDGKTLPGKKVGR